MASAGEFRLTKASSHPPGFTLFEIIVAIFILSLSVIPMMESFGPAMMSSASVEKKAIIANQARGTMERLRSVDFHTLSSKTLEPQPILASAVFGDVEETFTFEGIEYSAKITIDYEPEDASGDASEKLLRLTVALENVSLVTLKADY